jgi:hypothetical protein
MEKITMRPNPASQLKKKPQFLEDIETIPKQPIPVDAYSTGSVQVDNKAHKNKVTYDPNPTKRINYSVMPEPFQFKKPKFKPYMSTN